MDYHFSKKTSLPFDQAIVEITEKLKEQGFGVLSDIDVQNTFKNKLGIDFRAYRILGACSPKFAFEAIQAEPNIGALLPCSVAVQQHEDGKVEISAINPIVAMGMIQNERLGVVAEQVTDRLRNAVEAVRE